MKYGIKINTRTKVIESISFFEDNQVPKEYLEITEHQYNAFVILWQPFSVFENNDLVNDIAQEADFISENNRLTILSSLRSLSIEIDLFERLGEDITDLVNDFNQIKAQYDVL